MCAKKTISNHFFSVCVCRNFRLGENKMLKSIRNQNKNKQKRPLSTGEVADNKQMKIDE